MKMNAFKTSNFHVICDGTCEAYIISFPHSGCSVVGLDMSTYCRSIRVDGACSSFKALLHTLFHVLGRYHEHERPDRETYVDINEENIIEGIFMIVTNVACLARYIDYT